jgi:hypothetical protein
VYGACCYPPVREEAAGPTCMATTEKACALLPAITAWVDSKPCTGSTPQNCTQDINGACCYAVRKANCDYPDKCYSSKCTDGVTWKACLAAQQGKPTAEGGRISSYKFAAGAKCAADHALLRQKRGRGDEGQMCCVLVPVEPATGCLQHCSLSLT